MSRSSDPVQGAEAKVRAELADAMRKAGAPEEVIFAFATTGLVLLDHLRHTYDPELVAEWDAAIELHRSITPKRRAPKVKPTP